MNGGVESVETACKLARRWAYRHKGVPDNEAVILFPKNCFWGRSITASGACDDPLRFTQMGPFTGGFELFDYDSPSALEAMLKSNPNICAVVLEPIQGEGGVIVPKKGYLTKVRELCTKYNVLMCADEVQTGFGRTGDLMAVHHENVRPDIIVLAKSMSGGFLPASGCVADDHVMKHIGPGEHGCTFGGNPLAMAVCHAAVKTLIEEGMVENSRTLGKVLKSELLKIKSPLIKEVRGRGLYMAIEVAKSDGIKVDAGHLSQMLFKHGLLSKATKSSFVRLSPALVVTKSEVTEIAEICHKAIKDLEQLN